MYFTQHIRMDFDKFVNLFPMNPLFQMLLLSLSTQRHAPITKTLFKVEYDYIVVGAGSAGSVLANRLSEISCVNILLLEAGKQPPILTEIPFAGFMLLGSDIDWEFLSVPQKHSASALKNRQIPIPSGKAVGGSSVINGMVAAQGFPQTYDHWEELGAKGWNFSQVLPYFTKLQNNEELNSEYGYNKYHGPITISKPKYEANIKGLLMDAIINEGYRFINPLKFEQNGWYDVRATLRDGQRCSASKAYLVSSDDRPNLDILSDALVTKIDIQNRKAVGVYFEVNGTKHYVKARKEVIVSAGAYNTPKLLMLSGIGPRQELNRLGIPLIADLSGVGQNLQDHCGSILIFEMNERVSTMYSKLMNKSSIEEYLKERNGPLASVYGVSLIAFLNTNENAAANDVIDNQIYFTEGSPQIGTQRNMDPQIFKDVLFGLEEKPLFFCFSQATSPLSRGFIRLNSSNPYDPPEIDLNYYENLEDVKIVVKGFKTCMKIMENSALSEFQPKLIKVVYPGCEKFTDDLDMYLECTARAFPVSTSHHSGTAKMGDPNDETTVVDSELRVKTIQGLRVIDASVMPTIIPTNINLPTTMIAEKASDIIKSTITCSK